jgi:hypothetical protein
MKEKKITEKEKELSYFHSQMRILQYEADKSIRFSEKYNRETIYFKKKLHKDRFYESVERVKSIKNKMTKDDFFKDNAKEIYKYCILESWYPFWFDFKEKLDCDDYEIIIDTKLPWEFGDRLAKKLSMITYPEQS